MRRILLLLLILLVLSSCSQGKNIDTKEDGDELLRTEDVEIPSEIFTSEKQNNKIKEEEIKSSLKTYLDSHQALDRASYPFQGMIDEEKDLNEKELEKVSKITELTKQNDENFSNYILNNTLPKDYQEASERISQYITAYNEFLYELDGIVNDAMDKANEGEFPETNIKLLLNRTDVVNGREQKKIEEFLDMKNIETKAFGREP